MARVTIETPSNAPRWKAVYRPLVLVMLPLAILRFTGDLWTWRIGHGYSDGKLVSWMDFGPVFATIGALLLQLFAVGGLQSIHTRRALPFASKHPVDHVARGCRAMLGWGLLLFLGALCSMVVFLSLNVEGSQKLIQLSILACSAVLLGPFVTGVPAAVDRRRGDTWFRTTTRAGRGERLSVATATFVALVAMVFVNWLVYGLGIGHHDRDFEMAEHIRLVPPLLGYTTLALGLVVDALIAWWIAKVSVAYYFEGKAEAAAAED